MKKTYIFIAFLLSVAARAQQVTAADAKAPENLQIAPVRPVPGSAITIRYNPQNTVLSGVKDFEATAYLLEGTMPLAVEIALKEEKGFYTGSFRTRDSTRAFFISFSKRKGAELLTDNNEDKGYYSALYDKSGKEVMGANLALAGGFGSYNGLWQLKRDAALSNAFNKKEFAFAASRARFYNEYLTYLGRTGNDADKEQLKRELNNQLAKTSISEADMMKVKDIYENVLNDKEKADAVFSSLKNKFPNGLWKREELITAIYEDPDVEKKADLFRKVLAAYPANEENKITNYLLAQVVAYTYAEKGAYDKMEPYFKFYFDRASMAKFYYTFAAKLSGEGIKKKPVNVPKALEFVDKALSLLQEEMKDPSSKPSYLTRPQYITKLDYTYHSYLGVKGILLYHKNEPENAYALLKQSTDKFQGNNIYMNEALAFVAEKVKGPAAAQKELERFISEGKANPSMKDQLKVIYLQSNSEADFTQYMKQLEQATFNKLKADLAKKMESTRAPQFSLKNFSGQKVSLASLKGKIVVVDFWSMWCGPCKASFPTMQKLVDKYRNNPDVAFLFIDTWETGAERENDVTGFIAKNKYTFNVLYDEERKGSKGDFVVVSDFKVTGIPTKFVIDRDGNIRFRSSGYNGSADGLINELTAMIELAAVPSASSGPVQQKKVLE